MKRQTATFYYIEDILKKAELTQKQYEDLFAALSDDATYGDNVHSLVTGQYICEVILDNLLEEDSSPLLDKLQRILLDECDDKHILIDLE